MLIFQQRIIKEVFGYKWYDILSDRIYAIEKYRCPKCGKSGME